MMEPFWTSARMVLVPSASKRTGCAFLLLNPSAVETVQLAKPAHSNNIVAPLES